MKVQYHDGMFRVYNVHGICVAMFKSMMMCLDYVEVTGHVSALRE